MAKFTQGFILQTDASSVVLEVILSQEDEVRLPITRIMGVDCPV
jgi:hypothetical protein